MISTLISKDTKELGKLLREGGIVVFPTETVYGIGADSTNFESCLKIYSIKNRPLDNPLISHFYSIDQIAEFCHITSNIRNLINVFSPGPLTVVLRKKKESIFSLGLETLAVRIPAHEESLKLLQYASTPISAPSANPSGKPSFTRLDDVIAYFNGKVDGIYLANEPEIGIESTVVDLSGDKPILLRPGKISYESLLTYLPGLKDAKEERGVLPITSPGMKYRHYSPDAKVVLLSESDFKYTWETKRENSRNVFIGFHFISPRENDKLLSNNEEYMKNLYAFFIDADKASAETCYCEMPLQDQYFHPLLNRLNKAVSKN